MKPIIKWVGGKHGNLEHIRPLLPTNYNKYYEPFLGGAAVLLDINPKEAYVNDINPELINMYIQVREDVEGVIRELSKFDECHESYSNPKEFYYDVRKDFNAYRGDKTITQAARFIYLNKHCFNGLYRENAKGEFNVPFNGKLTGSSFEVEHLREVSKRLKDVVFGNTDFENFVIGAEAESFIFIDSPYDNSFTDYSKESFCYEDHVRLAKTFKELSDRGCYCMLTNHDTPLIRDLYKDYNIKVIDVRRSINRNGNDRKGKEVIITNY